MIFSAFLVLVTIISSQDGTDYRELMLKLPWSNMEDCEAWRKAPEKIISNYNESFKIKAEGNYCEPRPQPDEKPA